MLRIVLFKCAVWIENCKCDQLKSINNLASNTEYRICSLHFETDMFSNFQKNRLKPEAVPTLFDTMEVEFVDEPKNNDDLEYSISDFEPSLCSTPGSTARSLINSTRFASTSMGIETSVIGIQTPSYLSSKTPRKVSLQEKLKEKYLSPTLFVIVKSQIKNKERHFRGFRYSNEIKQLALSIYFLGPRVYNLLHNPLSLPTISKDKIIGFHESNYKNYKPAKNALKQPIACFHVSSSCTGTDLKDIIISTISFITDQGTNFVITKAHIDSFYNYDFENNLRLATKLKNAHIHPGPFENMRVYLAAQIFSNNVASGMSTTLKSDILSPSAQYTIDFISDMDKLFDIFNSYKTPNLKEFNRPFENTEPQINHLNKMAEVFRNMKVLITISSLKMLWYSLNPTKNPNYVFYTRCLNQDCLENLFCYFRQQHGNNLNPTPIEFSRSFKKIFCANYFKHSLGANCIEDLDEILGSELPQCEKILNFEGSDKNLFKFKCISIGTVDYRQLDIPEQNTLTYICGYLMRKCLEKYICQLNQSFLLSFYKAYPTREHSTFGNLMMTYNFVYELENIFIDNFPSIFYEDGVSTKLKQQMSNVPFNHPSSKFLNRALVSEKKLKARKLTILKHLAVQNKRRGKLSSKILLLHDNARPHTAKRTQELLDSLKWEVFPHPPYSPDLAPSDFHLFPRMKTWLGTQRFDDDEELRVRVTEWFRSQAANFYDDGISKLVHRYDKCLNLFGDYVEK
ncbi:hypothetical protein QTP88_026776 [Uroleucon formosanum]